MVLTASAFNSSLSRILFQTGSPATTRMMVDYTGTLSIGMGTTTPSAQLQVRGAGATSSTFALIVQNSATAQPFSVRDDGNLYLGASATGAIISATDGTDSVATTGNCGIRYRSSLTLTSTGADHYFRNYQGSRSATSGASRLVNFSGSFAPTSGTGTYEAVLVDGTINQTGGANGVTRGVYVNPTLTSASSFRAFETANNSGFGFYAGGTAVNYFGGNVGINTTTPNNRLHIVGNEYIAGELQVVAKADNTLTNRGFQLIPAVYNGHSTFTAWNNSGGTTVFGSKNTGNGNVTSQIKFDAGNGFLTLSTGTTSPVERLRIISDGKLGINTTTPTCLLDINSDIVRLRTAKTPTSASDTGNQGDLCWDASYLYICTGTNTWRRVAHATW